MIFSSKFITYSQSSFPYNKFYNKNINLVSYRVTDDRVLYKELRENLQSIRLILQTMRKIGIIWTR